MQSGAPLPTHVARITPGGQVGGLVAPGEPAAFSTSWGAVRATQLRLGPEELPEGYLVNHLVAMNLGAAARVDANFEGRGWQSHQAPHHGVTVIPAELSYASRASQGGEHLLVELRPDFVADLLGSSSAASALPVVLGARDAFVEHVLLALAEEARRGSRSALRAESLGTALVAHLAEQAAAPALLVAPPPSLPSPVLRAVLDFVAEHLDTPISLERLAAVARMDLYRFARAFKQSTGSSPHRYVLEARIARAKELLRVRTIPITEVALRTGFATPSHFSVTFRRITSQTPRAFRGGTP